MEEISQVEDSVNNEKNDSSNIVPDSGSEKKKAKILLKLQENFPRDLMKYTSIIIDDEIVKSGLEENMVISLDEDSMKDICLHIGGIEIYRESIKAFNGVDTELNYDLMVPVSLEGSRQFKLIFDHKSLAYLADYFIHGETKYSIPMESDKNITYNLLILDDKASKKLRIGELEDGNDIIIEDGKSELFIECELEEEVDVSTPAVENNSNYSSNFDENQASVRELSRFNNQAHQEEAQVQNNKQLSQVPNEYSEEYEDKSEGFRKIYGRMNVKKVTKLGLNPKELYEGNITRSSSGVEYQVTINETGNTVLRRIQTDSKNIIKPLLFIAGGAALMFFASKDDKKEEAPKPRAIDPIITNNPSKTTVKSKRKYQTRKTK